MARIQARPTVTVHDLVEGILYIAALRKRYFAPFRDLTRDLCRAFDLSMWQAYEWLEYEYGRQGRNDEIDFTVRLNEIYGDSHAVQNAVAGQLVGYAFRTWVPGNGVLECRLDESRLQRVLERNSIPQEMLQDLAQRFIREYDWPATERSWPPGFSPG